jgi:2-C-methyl-D-erythritol 4-phosphate cytidylyltransferase
LWWEFGSFDVMKKYAVIVAGGSGARMGTPVPKQFLLLSGRPVLWYSLNSFLSAYDDLFVILVVVRGYRKEAEAVVASVPDSGRVQIVEGGVTRTHSVQNGLQRIDGDSVVAVHDGVRCLASVELVRRCFEQAARIGSAIPVIDCKDSVRLVDDGFSGWVEGGRQDTEGGASKPLDRTRIKLVQTPQTFLSAVLQDAFAKRDGSTEFTDEATLVEAAGHRVHLIEGETFNIKITSPIDLLVAENILKVRGSAASSAGND